MELPISIGLASVPHVEYHPIHKRTYCNFSVYIREDSRKENILNGDLVAAVSFVFDHPLHNQ